MSCCEHEENCECNCDCLCERVDTRSKHWTDVFDHLAPVFIIVGVAWAIAWSVHR